MAVCLAQWPEEAPGTHVHGCRGNSYAVVERIFLSVGSQKGSVVLGWDTNLLRDYKARHTPSVCYIQQIPFQTHFLQKLPCSPPFTCHSITLVVQNHLLPPHTSWDLCVLPKRGSYSSWEAPPGSPEVYLGKNVKIPRITIYFIMWHHVEHPGTVQGYIRRAYKSRTPGRICLYFLRTAS